MRIQLLSDLHLELHRHYGVSWNIPESAADVIILAGDIDVGTHGVLWAADQAERLRKDILYVPGNHEYYGEDMFELPKALRAAAKGTRVVLMDNAEVVIGDTRFIGGTLWTNFGKGDLMDVALHSVNDYRKITANRWWNSARNRQRALRRWGDIALLSGSLLPEIAMEQHRKCLRFIRSRLNEPFNGTTVVVTHHAPTMESLRRSGVREHNLNRDLWPNLRFSSDSELPRVASYASNLDGMLAEYRDVIDVWAHGHIHETLDYALHGIRLISNPHGYLLGKDEALRPQLRTFNPLYLVDPAEGVSPILKREFSEPLAQLDKILAESIEHALYASHEDSKVAKMAGYYLQRLASDFNAQMRLIVAPLLNHLLGEKATPEDDVLAYLPFQYNWDQLFGPRTTLAVSTYFNPRDDETPSDSSDTPATYVSQVVKEMTELQGLLQKRLPQILAGERYMSEELRAMSNVRGHMEEAPEW